MALGTLVLIWGISLAIAAQDTITCTIWVQSGESIQNTIDQAAEGAVVCLAEGIWEENIKITKSLTLRGMGDEKTTIKGKEAGYPVVWIEPSAEGQTISVQAVITNCTITRPGLAGIRLGDSAQATITGCTISNKGGNGIELFDSAQATITNCTISENMYGILLEDSAQAVVRDNTIENNADSGIFSCSNGEVRGAENRMSGNGVDLRGNLPGELRTPLTKAVETEIIYPDERYSSLQEAIDALLPGGQLILKEGEYEVGVTITKKLHIEPQVEANVTLKGKSGGNTCIFSLVGQAVLRMAELTLMGGAGLQLGAASQATITDCTILHNKYGIELLGSSQATITSSTISKNTEGIELYDSAQVTIIDCTISKNTEGIDLRDFTQATITGCIVSEHEDAGIWLWDSAQATITGCIISENYWGGIWLWDFAQATITGCTISEHGVAGILLSYSAQATIEENKIVNNGGYGVALNQQSCYNTDRVFTGVVIGSSNTIPGPDEPNGNEKDDVCPEELDYLMTEEGGEYP